MPAYLVYICQSVSDRKELETYWKDMPRTLMGFDIKLHTAYRPFQLLEGEGPVEGVVVAEFPSMEEAKRWYDSPGYVCPPSALVGQIRQIEEGSVSGSS